MLYYLRLACSAAGSWADRRTSLISRERPVIDFSVLDDELRGVLATAESAWEAVLAFDGQAEASRVQRQAVDRAIAMPIQNQLLRDQIQVAATEAKVVPPSVSQVRKQVGTWFNAQILAEFGPVPQPVDDFPTLLAALGTFSRNLRGNVEDVISATITDLISKAEPIPG
jgi:hypothetical protein